MKFAASLIAIGASAIKLKQDDEPHHIQRMVDWNGDGVIQREEAIDQAYIFEALGYISEDDLEEAKDFYDDFPDTFTFEEVYNYLEGDEDGLEGFEGYIEFSEDVVLDIAANILFDFVDENGDDEVDIDEAVAFVEENFDEGEQDDIIEGFEGADEDGSYTIDRDEFIIATIDAVHSEEGLREEILVNLADFVDMFDVDCDYDGSDSGCRAHAEEFAD